MTGVDTILLVVSLHAVPAPAPVVVENTPGTVQPAPLAARVPARGAEAQEDTSASVAGDYDPGAPPYALDSARVAAAIRDLEVTDLSGRRWTRDDMRGRVVLLDFWATWCAPCLADLPHLKALRARHPRDRFEILGVSLDVTSRRSFISWLNRHRIEWPQIHERSGYTSGIPQQFGVDRLPRTVVISADGVPVALDVRGEQLVALIERLIACGGRCAPGGGHR